MYAFIFGLTLCWWAPAGMGLFVGKIMIVQRSPKVTHSHFAQIIFQKESPVSDSLTGLCLKWADPDLNRGHQDFQSCRLDFCKVRNSNVLP